MKFFLLLALIAIAYKTKRMYCLKCDTATQLTCAKSKFGTGQCVKDTCQCVKGFGPSKYGCQEMIKPTVTADTTMNNIPCNGDAILGASITFTCNSWIRSTNYRWFKDGVKLKNRKRVFYISKLGRNNAGKYSCAVSRNDLVSFQSKGFEVSFVKNAKLETSFKKPVVSGVPKKALKDQELTFKCDSVPAANNMKISFQIGSVVLEPAKKGYNDITLPMSKLTEGKISCSVKIGPVKISSEQIEPPLSLKMPPIADMTGPSVPPLGRRAVWTCSLRGIQDSAIELVSWSWKKNGKPILDKVSNELVIDPVKLSDKGQYHCEAEYNSFTSNSEKMDVTPAKMTHLVVSVPTIPVVGGYISMQCQVNGTGKADIDYTWKKNNRIMSGVKDNIIQINDVTEADAAGYSCDPKVGGVELGYSPKAFTQQPTPFAMVNPFLYKDTNIDMTNYQFRCESPMPLPGLVYVWVLNDKVLKEGPSNKLDVEVGQKLDVYSCQLKLNGKTSGKSSTHSVNPLPVVIETKTSTKAVIEETKGNIYAKRSGKSSSENNKIVPAIATESKNPVYNIIEKDSDHVTTRVVTSKLEEDEHYVLGEEYNLTCILSKPKPGSMFVWKKDDQVIEGETSDVLTIIADLTHSKYSCQIKYYEKITPDSNSESVAGKALISVAIYYWDGTPAPKVIKPLTGAAVDLVCKAVISPQIKDHEVLYVWRRGELIRSVERRFSVEAKDRSLRCTATIGEETKDAAIKIERVKHIEEPTLMVDPEVEEYSQGARYTLSCFTLSKSTDMNFEINQGDKCVEHRASWYRINHADSKHDNGNYSCKTQLQDQTTHSGIIPIVIGPPGKYCNETGSYEFCEGDAYNGTCYNNRCQCNANYTLVGDQCTDGGSSLVSSLLCVFLATFIMIIT